jgi:hypothetical protein
MEIKFKTSEAKDTSIIAYGYINGLRGVKITFSPTISSYLVWFMKGKRYEYYKTYPRTMLDEVIKDVTQVIVDHEQTKEDLETYYKQI